MASKRQQRQKMCGDKIDHKSYEAASRFAFGLARAEGTKPLVPYGCRFCGGVHLGHPNAQARQGLAARARWRAGRA